MLPLENYKRYGRQLILDGIGLPGQLALQKSSIIVVGAGGLGCPALQHLAASGIGRIGIVDHDRVEVSNLQRQILHTESSVGMFKAESAALALKRLNSQLTVDVIIELVTAQNVLTILSPYDIILDCTDNSATRYLLSDAAVALSKPLVSGAAQKYEGQLSIYNLDPEGPCYRCIFPKPPPPETVGSCSELGVLGVVTGIIGNMQALETIKLITGLHDRKPTMLLYSALGTPPFRNIKLRSRRKDCAACSDPAKLKETIAQTDYVEFCGGPPVDWENEGLRSGGEGTRARAKDLQSLITASEPIRIIDVRPEVEYGICHLPNSENIQLKDIVMNPKAYSSDDRPTFVVCRLGNDSQTAARALREVAPGIDIKDLVGGLRAWSLEVDPQFPQY